jgi:hypothetical protein
MNEVTPCLVTIALVGSVNAPLHSDVTAIEQLKQANESVSNACLKRKQRQ